MIKIVKGREYIVTRKTWHFNAGERVIAMYPSPWFDDPGWMCRDTMDLVWGRVSQGALMEAKGGD